jgi:3-oxoacyl-[acyl-carrier-protein] synthase II
MEKKRIVITGIGVISPIGIGKDPFWQSLKTGKSGVKPITLFDVSKYNVKVGGEISDFDPAVILGKRGSLDLDRSTKLLLSSAKLALDDAGLEINEGNSSQIGVVVGTTLGSLDSFSKFDRSAIIDGPRYVNPSVFINAAVNTSASRMGIKFKITGFNSTISTGMCSALDALDYACDFIDLNRIHTGVVGGVEDFSVEAFLGCYKLRYLSGFDGKHEPISCPFDKRRNGIVFSEGAVTFIVEERGDALKRKAHIYGEILGMASSFDPTHPYKYNPKGQGMISAMRMALKDADLKPEDIDCIFANANSTQDADKIEVKAIKEVFGGHTKRIPVTSVKSNIGESFSVSGGFSLAAALGAMEKGFIPSLVNYSQQDPECDLNFVLNGNGNEELSHLSRIMVNTFSSNGANSVGIIGKLQ